MISSLRNYIKFPLLPSTKNHVLLNRCAIKEQKSIKMNKLLTEQSTPVALRHNRVLSYHTISTHESKGDIDIGKVTLIMNQLLNGKKKKTTCKQAISMPKYLKDCVNPKKIISDNIRHNEVSPKSFKSYSLQINCFGSAKELKECVAGMRLYQKKKQLRDCLPVIGQSQSQHFSFDSIMPHYNNRDFVYKSFKR